MTPSDDAIFTRGIERAADIGGDLELVNATVDYFRLMRHGLSLSSDSSANGDLDVIFASSVWLPDGTRRRCLMAIFDRAFVTYWEQGAFRKTIHTRLIDRATITDGSIGPGPEAETRQVDVLTIESLDGPCQLLVPKANLPFHTALLERVRATAGHKQTEDHAFSPAPTTDAASDGAGDSDEWVPIVGGLFRLRRGDQLTPFTSYTDRRLPKEQQVAQLLGTNWLPEQLLTSLAQRLLEDKQRSVPDIIPNLSENHVFAPDPTPLDALLALGGPIGPPEVRPWLWPVLDSYGMLLLEQSEAVLAEWGGATAGHRFAYSGSDLRTYMTDRRFIITASLDLPDFQRGDTKLTLGLVSPALMSLYKGYKGLSRLGQDGQRRWVKHLRYEWISAIEKTTRTKRKQKAKGEAQERVDYYFRAVVRMPNGEEERFGLQTFEDTAIGRFRDIPKYLAKVTEFQDMLFGVFDRQLTEGEARTAQDPGADLYTQRWVTHPEAGYSIPVGRDGSASAPSALPAAWYLDPWQVAPLRYWDGHEWTGHVS